MIKLLFCFWVFFLIMATLTVISYHRAEGMPQEDGVSVQKSLVSAALRRLQR